MKKVVTALLISLTWTLQSHAAMITFNTWTTNEDLPADYSIVVSDTGMAGVFDVSVNVSDADAIGLFFDFGNLDIVGGLGAISLSNVNPAGAASPFASDQLFSTSLCGPNGSGCNLNGLKNLLPAFADEEWEAVLSASKDNPFTPPDIFSFTISVGLVLDKDTNAQRQLVLDDFLGVGARAQTFSCTISPNCSDSDKSFSFMGFRDDPPPDEEVPAPGSMALLLLGGSLVALTKRRKLRLEKPE